MNYLGLDVERSPNTSMGIRFVVDANCLADTDERTFPVSRHRSARIHKKLVRRHGGEFRKEPGMFKIGAHTIVVHPAIYAQVKDRLR